MRCVTFMGILYSILFLLLRDVLMRRMLELPSLRSITRRICNSDRVSISFQSHRYSLGLVVKKGTGHRLESLGVRIQIPIG